MLAYLVQEHMEGRGSEISAQTIMQDVFGVADGETTVVRMQMGRLRTYLDAFYAGEGAADPLRIVIPKGSYEPRFLVNDIQEFEAPSAAPGESRDRTLVSATKGWIERHPVGLVAVIVSLQLLAVVVFAIFELVLFAKPSR